MCFLYGPKFYRDYKHYKACKYTVLASGVELCLDVLDVDVDVQELIHVQMLILTDTSIFFIFVSS